MWLIRLHEQTKERWVDSRREKDQTKGGVKRKMCKDEEREREMNWKKQKGLKHFHTRKKGKKMKKVQKKRILWKEVRKTKYFSFFSLQFPPKKLQLWTGSYVATAWRLWERERERILNHQWQFNQSLLLSLEETPLWCKMGLRSLVGIAQP